MNELMDFIRSPSFLSFLVALMGAIITILVLFLPRLRQRFPIAYNVGIVGFPKSGKTVLITSLFAQIFTDRYLGKRVLLRGKPTIERVNRDLERLEIGKSLGPTTDQDLFAYRADVKCGDFPFKREYKVMIGDFPGENSKEFAGHSSEWLHESSYFKWVMEADAFIFIIDLARVLTDSALCEYRATMTKAIRAAWQNLAEYHIEGKKNLRRKPVLLVFTKADLLFRKDTFISGKEVPYEQINDEIMRLGFGDELPKLITVNKKYAKVLSKPIEEHYEEVIRYLRSQTLYFDFIFVSHFAKDEDGRMGIPRLVNKILPLGR